MSETENKNPTEDLEDIKQQLAQAQKEKNEYLSGWQRAKADFVNYKKEELERLKTISQYAIEDLVSELITVMDNFDLGLATLEKSGPVEKGIYMIRAQIADILKKRGLEKIDVKIGDAFNPKTTEVLSEIESEKPPGSIVDIIENGYTLNGKVIRPTRVKISKG